MTDDELNYKVAKAYADAEIRIGQFQPVQCPSALHCVPQSGESHTMTLDEMKLAVCKKLPALIHFNDGHPAWIVNWAHPTYSTPVCWPAEGLQVCHEAEKLLETTGLTCVDDYTQRDQYALNLLGIVGVHRPSKWGGQCEADYYRVANATYEQRLEALCRTWYPKRFKS